jgi:hypothetical protein
MTIQPSTVVQKPQVESEKTTILWAQKGIIQCFYIKNQHTKVVFIEILFVGIKWKISNHVKF